ncbi:protein kinase domain-containing protein [Aquisphaera insulae]|uniref:protein kinase domain-containing protein n=1 Tax=Aquisphaera insulae TaxID=2712864 RepID=UPI0013EC2C25|nr:SUMF1/EgtB/PvdO family nonheme iron enzyme [Aquisphaera insulae]
MSSDLLPLTLLQKIDEVCDSFEDAWRAGESPRIEDYLSRSTILARTALFRELLAREIELRRLSGQCPEAEDYEVRFGDHAQIVRTILSEVSPMARTSIHPLIGRDQSTGFASMEVLDRTDVVTTGDRSVFWDRPGGGEHLPERIGRFRPIRLLGTGNFLVYLAHDEKRGRDVAIKTARPGDPRGRRRLMSLADEARRLRSLDHPGIVRLHEFVPPSGEAGDDPGVVDGFIVLEYVAGQTLENLMSRGRIEPGRLARLVADVAAAVHHAHNAGLTHRDLKPSNILLDALGNPRVCDFGLAIDEEIARLLRGEVAGTVPYMAPEQVRGETNRLDGRTDIWALGVILYRGLTGRLPFRGRRTSECFREILNREPRPPRQFGEFIPRELERICMKCLSRPMTDRYLTAADLASELRRWLTGARPDEECGERPPAIPRGMRSFTGEDAGSFLSLLPGPRGSDGLPESIRFWKLRIEGGESARPFSVGVLYGPSGGGKSSFVRAGLLPLRDRRLVEPIVVDATPDGLEDRLLAEIRLLAPQLPADLDLADAIGMIRDDPELRLRKKILLVLDQFEQWLQGRPLEMSNTLVRALRHCDGRRFQALILVRDEYWMATTRLMRAVEIPLMEGVNAAAVELFDTRHARKVLEEFGRSLGQLEVGTPPAKDANDRFLDAAAVGLLGPDHRVVPVRLSLLVEVIRHRPWTAETLEALGGMEGIGVKFLEQVFDPVTSASASRFRREDAEAILGQLLPAPASAIRESPRSIESLRVAARCDDRPEEFAELLRLLETDLRLITSVEARPGREAAAGRSGAPGPRASETHYQLAHDYLIRPVRQWLERRALGTRDGRARLRLQAVTASWTREPAVHRLPSLLEFAGILTSLPRSRWTAEERRLMKASGRYHLSRLAIAAILIAAILVGWFETLKSYESRSALSSVLFAKDQVLLDRMESLGPYENLVVGELERLERRRKEDGVDEPVAGMLLYRFRPNRDRGEYLRQLLIKAEDPDRVELIRGILASDLHSAGLAELRETLADPRAARGVRLRAACTLRYLLPADRSIPGDASGDVAKALLDDVRQSPGWLRLLGHAEVDLVDPLRTTCGDPSATPVERASASEMIGDILQRQEDPRRLAAILVESQPDAAEILLGRLLKLDRQRSSEPTFRSVLADRLVSPELAGVVDEPLVGRQAIASIALDLLEIEGPLSALLDYGADLRVRSVIIDRLSTMTLARGRLLNRIRSADPRPGVRQAVLMIWAEIAAKEKSVEERSTVLEAAAASYRDDPDPGVHSAAELLLRRMDAGRLDRARRELIDRPRVDSRAGWRIGPLGLTFATCRPSLPFLMGSPLGQAGRRDLETPHYRSIGRDFEATVCEISIEQFRAFDLGSKPDGAYSLEDSCPINGVSWYQAAQFCNWLSAQDPAIPWDQACYPDAIIPGMALDSGAVERTGYRLPTEAEWEFLCRAGTSTSRFFGNSAELFPRYGWTWLNSDDRTRPVGRLLPNPWGFFDTLGNVWEWCHDGVSDGFDPAPYPLALGPGEAVLDLPGGGEFGDRPARALRGGAFCYSPGQARSAHRYAASANYSEGTYGFRVVRTLPRPRAAQTTQPVSR